MILWTMSQTLRTFILPIDIDDKDDDAESRRGAFFDLRRFVCGGPEVDCDGPSVSVLVLV